MVYCCEVYRDRDNCCDDASCLSPLLVEADGLRSSANEKVHFSDLFGFNMLWRLSIVAVAVLLVSGASASSVGSNPSSYSRSERIRTESVPTNGGLPVEHDMAGYQRNGHDSNSNHKDRGVPEAQPQNPSRKIDVNRHSILQIQLRLSSNLTDSAQGSSTDNMCKNPQTLVNQSKKRWFVRFDELPVHQSDQVQIHNKQHVQVRWTCDSAGSSLLGTGFASLLVPLLPHSPREKSSKTSGERTLLVALVEESGEDNDSSYQVMLARRLANLPRFEHPATDYPRKSQDNLVVTLELPGRTTLVAATPKTQENTRKKDTNFFSLCKVDIICIASFCVSAMIAKLGSGYKVSLPSTERCNRGLQSSRPTPLRNIASAHVPTLAGTTREVCDKVEQPFTSGPIFTSPSLSTYPTQKGGQFPHIDDDNDKHLAPTIQKNCEKTLEYPSLKSPPSLLNRRLAKGDFPFPSTGYEPLLPTSHEENISEPANVFMGEIIPRSHPPLCRGLFPASTSCEHASHCESTEKSLPTRKSQFHVSPRAGACAIRKCLETLQEASATVEGNEKSALDHQDSYQTSEGITTSNNHKIYQNQQTGIVHQKPKRQVTEIEQISEQVEVDDNDIEKMSYPLVSHKTATTSMQDRDQSSEIARSNEFSTHGGISHTGESLVPCGTYKSAQQVRYGKIKNDTFSTSGSRGRGRQQDCAVEKVGVLRNTPKSSTIVKDYPPVRMETDSKKPKSSSVTALSPPGEYDESFQQFHITPSEGTTHSKVTLCGKNDTSNNDGSHKESTDKSRPETNWLQRLTTGTTPAKPPSGPPDDFEFNEEEHSPKPGIYVVGMEQIREHANKRNTRSTKESFSYVSTLPSENESTSNGKGEGHTPVDISNSKKKHISACKSRKDVPEVMKCFANMSDGARQIVSTSDKNLVTKLTFTVFDQLQACKNGVECKHCYMESKAFSFPLSSSRRIANLSAATRRHLMMACPNATESLRDKLRRLEELQTREYQKVKSTGQEEFFSLVWDRLQNFSSTGTTKLKKKTDNAGNDENSSADEDSASPIPVKIAAKLGSNQLFDSNLRNDNQRSAGFDPNRSLFLSKLGRKQKKKRASTFVPDVVPSTFLVSASHKISEPPAWQFGQESTGLILPELVSTANHFDLRRKKSSKKRRLK